MIYVLYGEESYLLKKEMHRIIDKHVTFEKEMNTVTYDAGKTNIEEIIADAQTVPFFSDFKVIIVNHSSFLSGSNDTSIDVEVLNKYMDSPNESTILILVCDSQKLDSRKKIVKRLQKEATIKQFSMFNEFERDKFVQKECEKRNISFDKDAYREFCFRIGFSCERIITELDKLQLYQSTLQKEDIKALVTRPLDDNVFDVFQALLSNNVKRAYQYWLDFNAQNIDPIALIAMLASQYRFLHQVKILQMSGTGKSEIASQLQAHPYRVEKTLQSCSYINEKEISKTLNELAQLDQNIKAGRVDKKLGFEMFILQRGK